MVVNWGIIFLRPLERTSFLWPLKRISFIGRLADIVAGGRTGRNDIHFNLGFPRTGRPTQIRLLIIFCFVCGFVNYDGGVFPGMGREGAS